AGAHRMVGRERDVGVSLGVCRTDHGLGRRVAAAREEVFDRRDDLECVARLVRLRRAYPGFHYGSASSLRDLRAPAPIAGTLTKVAEPPLFCNGFWPVPPRRAIPWLCRE